MNRLYLVVVLSFLSCAAPTHRPDAPVAAATGERTTMTAARQASMTPEDSLATLMAGNERFATGQMRARDLPAQVEATASGQHPFAVVIGCIDSRVPPELVFDQGVGDIFAARIAGNFVNTDILGSVEFATKVAGSNLIVVLGHTECGAVKGACDRVELGNLTSMLTRLEPAVRAAGHVPGEQSSSNKELVRSVTDANVRLTVAAITGRSEVVRELVNAGQVRVVGALHDVATGRVTLLD